MVIFALAAVAALVLCAEMERWSLRNRDPQALCGFVLLVLAALTAAWAVGSVAR